MANSMSLALVLSANASKLQQGLGQGSAALKGFAGQAQGTTGALGGIGSAATAMLSTFGGIAAAAALAKKAFDLAATAEENRLALETMLGSAEKAAAMYAELKTFANVTPFETAEVIKAGKQLISFGVESSNVTATLTALGDVASGVGTDLQGLAAVYGKVAATGRVTGEILQQFADKGINLREALSKSMGVGITEVESLVRAGKVSLDDFKGGLEGLVNTGGKFAGGMTRASKGIKGLMSTVQSIGTDWLESLGDGIIKAFDLHELLGAASQFGNIGDMVKKAFDFGASIQPVKILIDTLLAVGDVAQAAFTEFRPLLQPAIDGIVEFAKGFETWWKTLPTVRQLAVGAFHGIAHAMAHIVDAARIIGKVVLEHIAIPIQLTALKVMASFRDLFREAAQLPDALGGDKFRQVHQGLGGMVQLAEAAAQKTNALKNSLGDPKFGESAAAVDRVFASIGKQMDEAQKAIDLGRADKGLQLLKSGFEDLAKASTGSLGVLESYHLKTQDLVALMKGAGASGSVLEAFGTGDLKLAEASVAGLADTIKKVKEQEAALFDNAKGLLPPFEEAMAFQKQISGLERTALVAKEALGAMSKLADERDEALSGKRAGVLAGNRSPFQKLASDAADLHAQFDKGILGWDDYATAIGRVAEDMDKLKSASDFKLPQAFLEGSAETVSLINRMNAQQAGGPVGVQNAGDANRALGPLLEKSVRSGEQNDKDNQRIIQLLRDIAQGSNLKVTPLPR